MNKADNFTLRTVSGLILLFLVIFCLYMTGYYFYFLMLSLSSIALYEMLSVFERPADEQESFTMERFCQRASPAHLSPHDRRGHRRCLLHDEGSGARNGRQVLSLA